MRHRAIYVLATLAIAAVLAILLTDASPFGSSPATGGDPIRPSAVEIDLGEMVEHVPAPFEVTLSNRGSRAAKIVGTPGVCVKAGCVSVLKAPSTIPARGSVTIRYRYTPDLPGDVDQETAVFLDLGDREGFRVPIHVRGSVVGAVKPS